MYISDYIEPNTKEQLYMCKGINYIKTNSNLFYNYYLYIDDSNEPQLPEILKKNNCSVKYKGSLEIETLDNTKFCLDIIKVNKYQSSKFEDIIFNQLD